MTVSREEKVYRSGVEKRIGSLEEIWTREAIEDAAPQVTVVHPDLSQLEERVKKLGDDWREHELELYGQGNGNGLTRRLERVEERAEILVGEIWWIRKGVLIVLILVLLSLFQMWWRFGW